MANDRNVLDDDYSSDEFIVRKKRAPETKTGVTVQSVLKEAAAALETLRSKKPLVQCMTGAAAGGYLANALQALGASPVLVEDLSEASPFAGVADGLLVNTGMVTKMQMEAMRAAVSHANMSGRPWLLDPVAVGVLPLRTFLAKELMRRFPAAIRGNASEISFLAGSEIAGRGVEATIPSDDVAPSAIRLAGVTHAAVVVTGATDYVAFEGAPMVSISNGSPMMARVSGLGGVHGGVCAAFLGALGGKARWESALAATLVLSIAGEMAAAKSAGPGSFRVALLDALYAVKPEDISKRGKIKLVAQA